MGLVPCRLTGKVGRAERVLDRVGPKRSINVFVKPRNKFRRRRMTGTLRTNTRTVALKEQVLEARATKLTVLSILVFRLRGRW